MKKIIGFLILIISFGFSFASDQYIYYYGNGCSHCAKVQEFFDDNNVMQTYNVVKKEIYFDDNNRKEFLEFMDKNSIPEEDRGVPFLVVNDGNACTHLVGDKPIINFFKKKLLGQPQIEECANTVNTDDDTVSSFDNKPVQGFGFIGVLLPAALADSINPCAFAVMLILMGSILSRFNNYRKLFISGFLFILAIFLSYLAMGLGLFKALASSSNTYYLKLFVGILGVSVGLFNLKDYFWYGKGFVMEVPLSWRPTMNKLIKSIVSPMGAFSVGILVSLFLLPCTSGPYITVLGYLASSSSDLNNWGIFYMVLYNLVFVLPLFIILFIVGFGYKNVEQLTRMKNDNIQVIHLIVGLLMLGLGLYVLNDLYSWIVF